MKNTAPTFAFASFAPILFALVFFATAILPNTADAQRLRDKDLVDTVWRMQIELGGKANSEANGDGDGGNAISRAALAMATSLISEVDIQFHFEENGELRIVTDPDVQVETDVEYSAWSINEDGNLLMGDTDSFSTGSDTIWIQEDGRLVAHDLDNPNMKASIWLERIDKE